MTNDSITVPDSAKLPWSGLSDEALLRVASFIGLSCVEADTDLEDVPFIVVGAIDALNALAFCMGGYTEGDSVEFQRRSGAFHDAIVNLVSAKDKISSSAIAHQVREAFRNRGAA